MLLLVMLVIKTHQATEKSGTTLGSAVFLAMADTKYACKSALLYMTQVLPGD